MQNDKPGAEGRMLYAENFEKVIAIIENAQKRVLSAVNAELFQM